MAVAAIQLRSIVSNLCNLLNNVDEYKLPQLVVEEIMIVKYKVTKIQDALNNYYLDPWLAHQKIDDIIDIFLVDWTEYTCDIDDKIDAFMLSVDAYARAKPQRFRRWMTKAKKNHGNIATAIQDISAHIDEVLERLRNRCSLFSTEVCRAWTTPPDAQPDMITLDSRVLAKFEHASKLFGTDNSVEKISNLLTQGNSVEKQKLLVVFVVGVGGLGKTTIANLVYERLRGQFQCKAFVSLSRYSNMKKVLVSILRQVTHTAAGQMYVEKLISCIRKFLTNKRYLIVIDDVRDKETWKTICSALVDNYLGSRVIVTTRYIDLATLSSVGGTIYELEPLSDKNSKRLLYKRIFNDEEEIHCELEEVTNKILKRCCGVPLAIKTIAIILASIPNKTKHEWYGVYNSMSSSLRKNKTPRDVLSFRYGDLPPYLKPCLLYLGMFPHDYEILKDRLIRMWVAEGFFDEIQGNNLYEIGESYFIKLVDYGIIQPVGLNENGSARSYRVNGMIVDLIISLSAHENVITIAGPFTLVPPVRNCKVRRLILQVQVSRLQSNEEGTKDQVILPTTLACVRSLIVFGDAFHCMPPLSWFPVVRVLALESFPSKRIQPKDLVRLHHLRYLALGGKLETTLLEQIVNLQLLKTLDLWEASIQELPASIFQLRKLEHLIINADVKLPEGIGNLMSLQELVVLNVDKSPNTLAELGNLTELRQLSIQGLHDSDDGCMMTFLQSLFNLRNIRSLIFLGNGLCSLDCILNQWKGPSHMRSFTGGHLTISRLPQWFSSLFELSFLSIQLKMLRQDDLLLLGALPMLNFLELQLAWDGITDKQLVIGIDQPFRSLVEFKFRHCLRCRLVFAPGVMPNLQKLVLYFNVRKREGGWFDIGLENLTSLEHVTVIVDCDGAQMKAVEDAEIKLKNAIYIHRNHPILELSRHYVERMTKDEMSPGRLPARRTAEGAMSPEMSGVPKYDIFEKMLENILQDPSPTPISLSLEFLEAITDGFSRELGRGGYGVVYKGVLNSRNVIAVKKIFDKHLVEDNNQFQNEVINLVGRKHQNIVQLVGYCVESRSELVPLPCGKLVMAEVPKMLLCFEYISNRSLDEHVSDELSGFDWDSRYEIIKGICSGLHFLHEICHIVHLDLKPQNIMMDATMIPKIADFGLSRLLGEQKSRTIIKENPAGTLGYMAPEYLMRGEVSTKADIFSFGVIIIQIITGRKDHPLLDSKHANEDNSLQSIETSIPHLTENVVQRWKSRFEKSKRSSPEKCIQQVKKCITLALECVNHDLEKRPTAGEIIEMLNS